jgi:hypothetical protein
VVRGKTFSSDGTVDPHGVVIRLATARTFSPGEIPIGKRIATYGDSKWVVIGVVGDVPQEKARRATPPNVYLPLCTTVVLHDTTVGFQYTTMILADRVAASGRCR